MSGEGAGTTDPKSEWHSVHMRVPFKSYEYATVAKRALEVDREQNRQFVDRSIEVEETDLVVNYRASTVRLLRLCTNSFLSSLDLVQQTIATFDPALPQLTDAELEERANAANSGNVKGIELRGDGKGAGSGEEIKG